MQPQTTQHQRIPLVLSSEKLAQAKFCCLAFDVVQMLAGFVIQAFVQRGMA
jgi:hypothetical protein